MMLACQLGILFLVDCKSISFLPFIYLFMGYVLSEDDQEYVMIGALSFQYDVLKNCVVIQDLLAIYLSYFRNFN